MLCYNAANIFHRMVFILGVCDGNATAASAEYRRRYPNRRIPNPKTIQRTFNTLGKQVRFRVIESTANVILNVSRLKRKTFSTQYSAVHVPVRVALPDVAELRNRWCGGHLLRTDCILLTSKKYNSYNLGILPVAWIFATG
jgi:hypothetical protein